MTQSQVQVKEYHSPIKPTWCAGCGDWALHYSLMQALTDLGYHPHQVVLVFDIGCLGNGADKIRAYSFKSLHGRALVSALGIKYANHQLPVIAMIGDGGMYWEGASHWITLAQRNEDITVMVANNQIYGLTTGQTSPTSETKCPTKTYPEGTIDEPVNPIAVSLAAGATFVARAWVGDPTHMQAMMKAAIEHKGFAILDILQTCITFNKVNTFEYYKERVYKLDEVNHNPQDKMAAYKLAEQEDKTPIGIFYQVTKPTIYDKYPPLKSRIPLIKQKPKTNIKDLLKLFK